MKTFKELFEKKLTPAELKKREEIAKAMERENPGMDMGKKMAIATAAAKRVAEETELEEAAQKTPEQKLQDIRDAIGLAREARRMKGQRIQSKREIDLQRKHDELSQKMREQKNEEVELEENSSIYMSKIEGGSGKGKGFGDKGTTVDDHLSAMKHHSSEYQKAMKEKRDADARHHGMKYHKHKDQIERLGDVGNYRKEDVDEAYMSSDRSKQMFKRKELDHELRHEVEPKRSEPADPHAVHINGKKPTNEAADFHDQAQEHKKKSDKAMDKNDMEAYHHHMSNYHEALGQWEESKGRSSNAQKHYDKAEGHHELSLKKSNQKNEGTDMLSFKYFQELLDEAKKKCKESSSEIELAHGEMLNKDDEDDEDEEIKEGFSSRPASYSAKLRLAKKMEQQSKERREQEKKEAEAAKRVAEEVEIDEQAPVAPVPGMKDAKYAIMVHPESKQRVTIDRKNKKNYPASEGWKEVAPGVKLKKESVELEELSKKPLLSYLTKATKQEPENIAAITKANKENDPATADKALSKFTKRSAGMDRAVSKMYAKYDKPKNESVEEVDEGDELNMRHKFVFNKTAAGKAREVARNREELKMQMKKTKEMGGITGPKGKLPEEVELDEVSPFDWKAYAKEKGTASSNKTKTFHDVKKTSTGTVYTKQVNPDGTSKGSGDDAAKTAEKADAPKRGRGRPAGVGAKTGSYKPRDPAKKAASAAKAAASKAANRAARNEEFDNEFMGSLIEGFEDEDFDDFLQCEEFDELDEATQEALINFINEKSCGSYKMKESLTGKQHKLDKNKNGKLDREDFKLLRKEETEQIQESVDVYAAFLSKKQ